MSYLQLMQDRRELPQRAFLYFWDIIDLIGDGEDKTHIAFSDTPETGGYDESTTRKQLGCTDRHLSRDDYRIVPSNKGEALQDSIYSIDCEDCRAKALSSANYSGLFEEE